MFFIICLEKLLHIGSHFSLRKWRQWPHFPNKLAAVASFFYKIGGGGLIFLQNWRRRQGFGKITGGCSDMVWILGREDQVPCQYYKSSDNIIFYRKKVQEIKKKWIVMLLLQRFYVYIYIFTFIDGNCPLSRYIVFHIHFPTTRMMLRFWYVFFFSSWS